MNNDGLLKVKGTHFYMVGGGYYQPIDIMCQSPIYRDTLFYELRENLGPILTELCQSPIHRDTHFYSGETEQNQW